MGYAKHRSGRGDREHQERRDERPRWSRPPRDQREQPTQNETPEGERERPIRQESPTLSYDEFSAMMDKHTWVCQLEFEQTSFQTLFAVQREEQELFRTAVRGGPELVTAYFNRQRGVINRLIRDETNKAVERNCAVWETYIKTGDPDFDKFRELVRHFDWWYEMSDDGSVWRSGAQRHDQIKAIVKEHGGIYETYYNYMRDKNR